MRPTRIIPRADTKVTDLEPMFRDHHALLSGQARIDDQLAGEIHSVTYNSTSPPVLSLSMRRVPASVLLLSARRSDGTGSYYSGAYVAWTFGGTSSSPTVTVDGIGQLTAAVDYDVTLWVSEG